MSINLSSILIVHPSFAHLSPSNALSVVSPCFINLYVSPILHDHINPLSIYPLIHSSSTPCPRLFLIYTLDTHPQHPPLSQIFHEILGDPIHKNDPIT
jgi:hypothetical protein